jgi:hypothetical protein
MSLLLKIGLALLCVAVSALSIFFGSWGVPGARGIYLLVPLVWIFYGLWNLFLLILAFTGIERPRMVWLNGIPSALAVLSVLILDGDVWTKAAIWTRAIICGVILLNWLAIKTLGDLRTTATDVTSGA